MKRAQ